MKTKTHVHAHHVTERQDCPPAYPFVVTNLRQHRYEIQNFSRYIYTETHFNTEIHFKCRNTFQVIDSVAPKMQPIKGMKYQIVKRNTEIQKALPAYRCHFSIQLTSGNRLMKYKIVVKEKAVVGIADVSI